MRRSLTAYHVCDTRDVPQCHVGIEGLRVFEHKRLRSMGGTKQRKTFPGCSQAVAGERGGYHGTHARDIPGADVGIERRLVIK